MAISYTEHIQLTCAHCRVQFTTDAWALVDAAERPDLAEALRDGTLNLAPCPACGDASPAGTALLFHDPAGRRVYFAVPPDTAEHTWREQAQALLYALVGSLPDDQRRPYLGDVQVEHELAGVRRAVLRRAHGRRAAGTGPAAGKPVESIIGPGTTMPPASRPATDPPPNIEGAALLDAVRALLAADTADEFQAIIDATPALLGDQGDAAVEQLAVNAYAQGQPALGDALREARATLARMRGGAPAGAPEPPVAAPAHLPAPAYQALLQASSPALLNAVIRDYPLLLEPWADDELAARTEAALDEGNERLAQLIEAHRDALEQCRMQADSDEFLLAAVRALMLAEDDDAIADVLTAYPMLLTDQAQDALFGLAAGARAQGDNDLAEYAITCRALLRKVRAGLDAH